jgi:hypothetical protein
MLQNFKSFDAVEPPGERMTIWPLPVPSTKRWTVRRKADLVAAVAGGLLTVDEACDLYRLSVEEFTCWQRAVDRCGTPGLRVTKLKQYRATYELGGELLAVIDEGAVVGPE